MVENFIFPLTRSQFDELVRKIDGVSNQRLNYNQFMFKIKKGGLSRETPILGRVTPASDTLDNVVSKLQQKVKLELCFCGVDMHSFWMPILIPIL